MGFQNFLENLRLHWAQPVHACRDFWRRTSPDVHVPKADPVEMVRIGPRGVQTAHTAAGVSDGGEEDGENQGILWIILVLIEIGVVVWVLFTVMIAIGTWWAGLFRSEEVEDWEEGKREE